MKIKKYLLKLSKVSKIVFGFMNIEQGLRYKMNTYIYVLRLVKRLYDDDAWTEKDKIIVNDHFIRLKQDHEKGIVKLAGRTERTDDDGFGIVIFEAPDDMAADGYMNDDPAVRHGLMTAKVRRFRPAII